MHAPHCDLRRPNSNGSTALAVEIDRRREALLDADRDVRTLEKLRESQFQAHREEESHQQAKLLDEAALQTMER